MCTQPQLQLPATNKEMNGEIKAKKRGKRGKIKKTKTDKRRGK
jgi:hypothetical protein